MCSNKLPKNFPLKLLIYCGIREFEYANSKGHFTNNPSNDELSFAGKTLS